MDSKYTWKLHGNIELPSFLSEIGQGSSSFSYSEWSIIYVVNGSCKIQTLEESLLLSKDTGIWVKNANIKCAESDEIAYACIGGIGVDILGAYSISILGKENSQGVFDIIQSLFSSAKLGILDNKWINSSAAYEAATRCCSLCEEKSFLPELVTDTIRLIKDKYPFIYGVEELSEMLGVSKCHLIRVFSSHVGISPGQYLKEERLKNSLTLLQSGRYAVKEVAAMVGYEGENYFCKVFKKRFGVTPGKLKASRPLENHVLSKEENMFYL